MPEAGAKPLQTLSFEASNDPMSEEKIIEVVGLYLDPPERRLC